VCAVGDENMTGDDVLAAGDFSPWMVEMQRALQEGGGIDVPCGTCTACCTSSQFVHIAPDEKATLARIPKALRFSAPGLPPGHVVLGYHERGHCPMLRDGLCSIYEHRPRTCRTYDCRVFPASGVDALADGKPDIARRAAQWRFRLATDDDRVRQQAVRAAADYLAAHADLLEEAHLPGTATQRAALAVELHEAFLRTESSTGRLTLAAVDPEREDLRRRIRQF